MARLVVAAFVLVALASGAHAFAASKHGRPPCKTRGDRTVIATEGARAFVGHRVDGATREYYGCVDGRGPSTMLWTMWPDSTCKIGFFHLSGVLVASAARDCSHGRRWYARVVDLGTRSIVTSARARGMLLSLLLDEDGTVVFLVRHGKEKLALSKVEPSQGQVRIASGDDIDPRSVAVGIGTVYWRQAGVTRSAPLGHDQTAASSFPARGSTLLDNGRAVVYADRSDDSYYGRVRGRSRVSYLGEDRASGSSTFSGIDDFALAGTFVALAEDSCGIDRCDHTARTVDLWTGKEIRGSTDGGEIVALRLAPGGSLALVHADGDLNDDVDSNTVQRVQRSGTATLDSGPDVDARSLAVSARWMYWRRGGETRAAPIR